MEKPASSLLLGFAIIIFFFWPSQSIEQRSSNDTATETQTYLIIDKLSLRAPIVEASENSEEAIQTTLKRGVVHLPDTAKLGELGNYYLVGHSSDYPWSDGEYPDVFARLPELALGNEVLIETANQTFVYVVIKTLVVPKNDLTVLSQDTSGRRLLTLQTSYPVGTADKRFLVIAQLQEK